MFRTDPLLMVADVATIVAEHPHVDEWLIRAIYYHLLATMGDQPTLAETREYVGRLTGCFDDATLRVMLGLAMPVTIVPVAGHTSHLPAVTDELADVASDPCRPGRPAWTRELFWARYRAAQALAAPPYTYRAIAQHFEVLDGARGTEPEYVRKLARRYGLPPE